VRIKLDVMTVTPWRKSDCHSGEIFSSRQAIFDENLNNFSNEFKLEYKQKLNGKGICLRLCLMVTRSEIKLNRIGRSDDRQIFAL
jgi:hypothetical protein